MEPGRPGHAPAKINLTLHITGQRPDGYHLLDSLVVFAGLGDQIEATLSRDLTLAVSGPFAAGVPTDGRNLVLKAAEALRSARGVTLGAAIRLTKALPHAAGLGSGSSDAAATLALLAQLWNVAPLADDDPAVLALGADVPVCRHAPAPVRMRGHWPRPERRTDAAALRPCLGQSRCRRANSRGVPHPTLPEQSPNGGHPGGDGLRCLLRLAEHPAQRHARSGRTYCPGNRNGPDAASEASACWGRCHVGIRGNLCSAGPRHGCCPTGQPGRSDQSYGLVDSACPLAGLTDQTRRATT